MDLKKWFGRLRKRRKYYYTAIFLVYKDPESKISLPKYKGEEEGLQLLNLNKLIITNGPIKVGDVLELRISEEDTRGRDILSEQALSTAWERTQNVQEWKVKELTPDHKVIVLTPC